MNINSIMGLSPHIYGMGMHTKQQRPLLFENTNNLNSGDKMVNGIQSNLWHSMSDERRSQFMREKRKGEAYKTELCKGFIRSGYCRYGEDCRFAHFQEELRVRSIHPKFKTELCRNYATRGICVYGSRCQFIHRSPNIKNPSESDMYVGSQRNHFPHQNFRDTPTKTSSIKGDHRLIDTVSARIEASLNVSETQKPYHEMPWDPLSSRNMFTESNTSNAFAIMDVSSSSDKKFARSCFPILSQKSFL